jgi:hypothetical protein
MVQLPPAPRIAGALRASAVEFYYQSIRLVGANLALLLAPLLAIPASGVFRLAALIARGEPPDFSDVTGAWRAYARTSLALGAGLTLTFVVLAVDVLAAIGSHDPLAWTIATLAGWGLFIVASYALVAWPLLVDPHRSGTSLRGRLRLAGLLLVAFPVRLGALTLLMGTFILASAIAVAALVSISLAYVALVASHYVLPAADRLEARLEHRPPPAANADG